MKTSTKAIRILETLANPEGPKVGELIRLAMTKDKPTAALTGVYAQTGSGQAMTP